eukprot:TRINITY_DN1971_c0_g1_i2.p1 TRINITY_DN1971_c0_g1~~TRINITY_DN1971_c0_g1_i2.p1  ORF type:complete len:2308 (-),score=670.74 TRINITY_DN1971_c0_g1_i2:313-7236(-)
MSQAAGQSKAQASSSSSLPVGPSLLPPLDTFALIVAAQIRNLVLNLSKKNYKTTVSEINSVVTLHGHDAHLYFLRCLVSQIDIRDSKSQHKDHKDSLKIQLLREEIAQLSKQPHFASLICQALEGLFVTPPSSSSSSSSASQPEDLLTQLVRLLKLSLSQEIFVALGVAHSVDPLVQHEGIKFLRTKLPELTQSNTVRALPENLLHELLYCLRTHEGFARQRAQVLKTLTKLFPSANSLVLLPFTEEVAVSASAQVSGTSTAPVATTPTNPPQSIAGIGLGGSLPVNTKRMFSQDSPQYGSAAAGRVVEAPSVVLVMEELGPTCTSSAAMLRDTLEPFPKLKEKDVAMLLGMMARRSASNEPQEDASVLPLVTNFTIPTPTADATTTSWNAQVFVDTIRELYPRLNWAQVIRGLDHPGFLIHDPSSLVFIAQAYKRAAKDAFPTDALVDDLWQNTSGQLSLLRLAVSAPPDLVNWTGAPRRQPVESNIPPGSKSPAHLPWFSLALIETLLRLADAEPQSLPTIRAMFDVAARSCPDVLILALVQVRLPVVHNGLPRELAQQLMDIFLSSQAPPGAIALLQRLWMLNNTVVMRGMMEMYFKDPTSLSRLLDLSQELKVLPTILEARPFQFAIDMAVLASQREYLFLEKWILERFQEQPSVFGPTLATFLKDKIKQSGQFRKPILPADVAQTLFRCLAANLHTLPASTVEELKQLNPRFPGMLEPAESNDPNLTSSSIPSMGPGTVGPSEMDRIFPPEIEERANSYFQRIYGGTMSIDEIITLLHTFKHSRDPVEADVFACMIHNLFDEYKFFPKYPDRELRITGVLFGSLVQHQLVVGWPLGMALRYTLESLKKPPESKMFRFGLYALEQFKSRFAELPQYCSHILQIPHIKQYHPEIVAYIEEVQAQSGQQMRPQGDEPHIIRPPPGLEPQQPPNMPAPPPGLGAPPVRDPTVPAARPAVPVPVQEGNDFDTSLPLNTLVSASSREIVQPDDKVKDKIHFIFNNVSQSNMEQKANELKDLLRPEYYDYLAQYLVVKRISLEANFHNLYLAFTEKLALPGLIDKVLLHTVEMVHALANSDKLKTDASERTLLKNLGMWLGSNTLAQNKPLFFRDISLKDILFDAYDRGTLPGVIPFVSKVMEHAGSSKVFRPPNPWVMGIVRLLAELNNLPELKTNMRFEIQFLCTNLGLDLNEVKPSDLLRYKTKRGMAENISQVPQDDGDQGLEMPEDEELAGPGRMPIPAAVDLTNLASYVYYNPSIPLFQQQPHLMRRVVPVAIESAIREIIAPVVERSVTIATITTKELVCKDFATEPDENRMRKAAHMMVQNLAGSLALVTCKEPLRVSMGSHLRARFQAAGDQMALAEHAVTIVVADNLDLACAVIERAAVERAVRDTDEALATALLTRRKHREIVGPIKPGQPQQQPFYDPQYFTSRYLAMLPDVLRPKSGGLQPHQLRVYDDFMSVPYQGAPTSTGAKPGDAQIRSSTGLTEEPIDPRTSLPIGVSIQPGVTHSGVPVQYVTVSGTVNQDAHRSSTDLGPAPAVVAKLVQEMSTPEALEKINSALMDLQRALSHVSQPSLMAVPPDHEVHHHLRTVPLVVSQALSRNEVALATAQKVFSSLYESGASPLHQEAYLAILEALRNASNKVVPELTNWIVYSSEDRKFNRDIMAGLLRAQLLNVSELDEHLSKLIDGGRNMGAVEFCAFIIRQCIIEGRYVTPSEMSSTFDVFNKLVQRGGAPETISRLLEEVRQLPAAGQRDKSSKKAKDPIAASVETDPEGLREQVTALFKDWVMICTHPAGADKAVTAYVGRLQQAGVLKKEDLSLRFFRICIEISIEGWHLQQEKAPGGADQQAVAYQAIDSFAKLVVLLVKFADPVTPNIKATVLSRVLNITIKVLTKEYEARKTRFNQKPYFRLFDDLLIDLMGNTDPAVTDLLVTFSSAFSALRPERLPGFGFAWLELISHRNFMPRLLMSKNQKGWPHFQRLLIELLRFLEPYLRTAQLTEPLRVLYKGTLRVLLVLLHDFPEFLCDYHFSFCDVIPPSCIQMRNLILSAFPRSMRLPDPFTPNLKVDLLPEINQPPRILSNYQAALQNNLRMELDTFLKTRTPATFLTELRTRYLMLSPEEAIEAGTQYNVPVLNALVLYVGMYAIQQLQAKPQQQQQQGQPPPIAHAAMMEIFQHLTTELDMEGRYLFFNAISNQLRYPNNHTHYFSCALLSLFADAQHEIIREQITRVLLERLIVNRPHPWGLLITFMELIKNTKYSFWSHAFTRCAPEIERLFDSVARSCMAREKPAETQQPPARTEARS